MVGVFSLGGGGAAPFPAAARAELPPSPPRVSPLPPHVRSPPPLGSPFGHVQVRARHVRAPAGAAARRVLGGGWGGATRARGASRAQRSLAPDRPKRPPLPFPPPRLPLLAPRWRSTRRRRRATSSARCAARGLRRSASGRSATARRAAARTARRGAAARPGPAGTYGLPRGRPRPRPVGAARREDSARRRRGCRAARRPPGAAPRQAARLAAWRPFGCAMRRRSPSCSSDWRTRRPRRRPSRRTQPCGRAGRHSGHARGARLEAGGGKRRGLVAPPKEALSAQVSRSPGRSVPHLQRLARQRAARQL